MNFFRLGDEIECQFILDVEYNFRCRFVPALTFISGELPKKKHGGVQRGSNAKDCSGEAKA